MLFQHKILHPSLYTSVTAASLDCLLDLILDRHFSSSFGGEIRTLVRDCIEAHVLHICSDA